MIPRKLVYRMIRALPLLILAVVLAPALVLYMQRGTSSDLYQSTATIWVLDPDQIQRASLDVQNAYLTPAQRQASVLRDLLMTESFRLQVAEQAGLIPEGSADGTAPLTEGQRNVVSRLIGGSVEIEASGANLLTVTTTLPDPGNAQAVGGGVISAYDQRLRSESERQDAITLEYFDQQLAVADLELDSRRTALQQYIAAHPNVDLAASGDLEYRSLAAQLEAQNAIVESLNLAVQSTHLSAVSSSQALAARFNVLDAPSLPLAPIAKSRMQQFGLPAAAALLGVMVGATYLLIAFRTDHTILSAEDLRGVPQVFLGYAPQVRAPRASRWSRWLRRRDPRYARREAASFAVRKAL